MRGCGCHKRGKAQPSHSSSFSSDTTSENGTAITCRPSSSEISNEQTNQSRIMLIWCRMIRSRAALSACTRAAFTSDNSLPSSSTASPLGPARCLMLKKWACRKNFCRRNLCSQRGRTLFQWSGVAPHQAASPASAKRGKKAMGRCNALFGEDYFGQ